MTEGVRHRGSGSTAEPGPAQPSLVPPRKPNSFNNNQFNARKSLAKGLVDVALLSSNLNSLKQVLKRQGTEQEHPYFQAIVVALICSIGLQIVIAFILWLIGQKNLDDEDDQDSAMRWNDVLTGLVLLQTVLNVSVTQFMDF